MSNVWKLLLCHIASVIFLCLSPFHCDLNACRGDMPIQIPWCTVLYCVGIFSILCLVLTWLLHFAIKSKGRNRKWPVKDHKIVAVTENPTTLLLHQYMQHVLDTENEQRRHTFGKEKGSGGPWPRVAVTSHFSHCPWLISFHKPLRPSVLALCWKKTLIKSQFTLVQYVLNYFWLGEKKTTQIWNTYNNKWL